MQRFTSRKFLLTLAAIGFAIFGVLSGHLTYDQASNIVQVAVGAYLASEGIVDAAGAYSQVKVAAAAAEKPAAVPVSAGQP